MEARFYYVVATDMNELVTELNKLSQQNPWFNVVYMSNGVAIIDKFPKMVVNVDVDVDHSEFEEVEFQPTLSSPSFA